MALKEGWRDRFFEDFEVGDVYRHPLGRTVTTTDNIWFTLLTQNTAPIHFDHHYASQTEFGETAPTSGRPVPWPKRPGWSGSRARWSTIRSSKARGGYWREPLARIGRHRPRTCKCWAGSR